MTSTEGDDLVNRLLADAEAALIALDWATVRARCDAVLALDPDNQQAARFQQAAARAMGAPTQGETQQATPAPNGGETAPPELASKRDIDSGSTRDYLGAGVGTEPASLPVEAADTSSPVVESAPGSTEDGEKRAPLSEPKPETSRARASTNSDKTAVIVVAVIGVSVLVAAIVGNCVASFNESASVPSTAGVATPVLTRTPTPVPVRGVTSALQRVSNEGQGVRMRTTCDDGETTDSHLNDNVVVMVKGEGIDECIGWLYVANYNMQDVASWVRREFVSALPTPAPPPVQIAAPSAAPAPRTTQSCPTPEQARYFSTVGSEFTTLGDGLAVVETQFRRAGANPQLILTDNWRSVTTSALAKIRISAEALQRLQAPLGVDSIDRDVKTVASEYLGITYDIASAIDDLDDARMAKASRRIGGVSPILSRARVAAQNFCP